MPARFYLALGEAQAGNSKAAIEGWQQLAAETPADAPVRAELQRRIEEAAKQAGIPAPALAAPTKLASAPGPTSAGAAGATPRGPTAEQMRQAAQMSPQDREAMIRGMVGNLAQRLEANPDDPEGWLRLARAYTVLKEPEKAADAFDHAAKLKPDDTGILVNEVQAMLADKKPQDAIPEPALALLHRIEAKQPDQPAALGYLGLAEAQARHPEAAAAYWRRLLPLLPADSDEHKMVTAALDAVEGK
jgi:cytochrome c-type biogenesis protein CcmH